MEKLKNYIKNEFWTGYNLFERVFMLSMVLLQIVVYCFAPDSIIGMICGISGVICVALTAKGKLSSYIFNFIQIVTYMYIVWGLGLYLEFYENVFYFVTCIIGVFVWKKNMTKETNQVKAKKLSLLQCVLSVLVIGMGTVALGYIGQKYLGNTLPYYDAFTNVMAIAAQLLMVFRYREQWLVWIVIDVVCLIMFCILGQWSMVAMYIAWTINAFYGWYNWNKLNKETNNA